MAKEGEPLRQWEGGGYDQEGRYSTLTPKHDSRHEVPKNHGNGMRSMPKDAGDPGRRHKD